MRHAESTPVLSSQSIVCSGIDLITDEMCLEPNAHKKAHFFDISLLFVLIREVPSEKKANRGFGDAFMCRMFIFI